MLNIVTTSNAYTRPKYVPKRRHNQWGVYDTELKKTILRNVTFDQAQRRIANG